MMMSDGVTLSKIEACRDAARVCADMLLRVGQDPDLLADKELVFALAEASRVTKLSADCLERLPDLRDMVLSVCVEISERAALACAKHLDDDGLSACGETLAACAAICAGAPEIEMVPAVKPEAPIAAIH